MPTEILKITPGSPEILGANIAGEGVNFALYSSNATAVSLVLFENPTDKAPSHEIPLSLLENRTADIWHIFVEGLKAGQLYGFHVDGPHQPKEGLLFYPQKILLDPYAKAVTDVAGNPKGIVIEPGFDWQGVTKPRIPLRDTIIYEIHIRGLTIHPSAEVEHPGSYRGVTEKIPYFQDLGVTALEFLPLQEFNHQENPHKNPLTGEILGNYWGYSTIAFFAPKGSYCSSGDSGQQVAEFKEMVRELHRAGLEVILDIVFNHTAEMGTGGPIYHFRGIDNRNYYILQKNRRRYQNLTGCGNTFSCNHPAGVRFILDCLKYWVVEMGVDGFRFDLATIFYRAPNGDWLENPPVLQAINSEPVLREVKLIAEPWDTSGSYRSGNFGGENWCDWNDRFRDDVRRFWRGDINTVGNLATRISGSADHFAGKKSPLKSINFFTCHDGFTLYDMLSYNQKNNLANGHQNQDGAGENFSFNYGIEGDTEDPKISRIRIRQAKNFLAVLFLSQGVPLILGGDEFLRTQKGNNNPYCQDNEISWYHWDWWKKNAELFRFCRLLIRFRLHHSSLRRQKFFSGEDHNGDYSSDVIWYSSDGRFQDWRGENRTLACFLDGTYQETGAQKNDNDMYFMFNANAVPIYFKLPKLNGKKWFCALDNGKDTPEDIYPPGEEKMITGLGVYRVSPRCTVVLIAK